MKRYGALPTDPELRIAELEYRYVAQGMELGAARTALGFADEWKLYYKRHLAMSQAELALALAGQVEKIRGGDIVRAAVTGEPLAGLGIDLLKVLA